MNLIELKQYMQQVKITTIQQLCTVFSIEAETLRCMLSHWIIKGKIRSCIRKPACGSTCFKCPAANAEMYEWVSG
jgi:putative ferrous iron transport protein C